MLKGKDLRLKGDGHTLECWYNSIEPSPIIFRTTKIESISYDPQDGKVWHKPCNKKPEGFDGF